MLRALDGRHWCRANTKTDATDDNVTTAASGGGRRNIEMAVRSFGRHDEPTAMLHRSAGRVDQNVLMF